MGTQIEENKIWLYNDEYEDMLEYIDRLKETVSILSDGKTVLKVREALKRIDSGEYLTKEEMVFD